MTPDHISATMANVMWREDRDWNVGALQILLDISQTARRRIGLIPDP
jgi:hypothetical protein